MSDNFNDNNEFLEGTDPEINSAFETQEFDTEGDTTEASSTDSEIFHFLDEDDDDVSDVEFPELQEEKTQHKIEEDMLHNIPVNLSVELGRTKISLKEVMELNEGSIIELERLVGEPLDLVVNGQIIAQGEVVAIDNNYGLRITNVVAQTTPA